MPTPSLPRLRPAGASSRSRTPRRLLVGLALTALVAGTGCQSAEMHDAMDQGEVYEKQARELARGGEHPQAAEVYSKSVAEYARALEIAQERETVVFISFLNTKMSIVLQGEGESTIPAKNPKASWEEAIALFQRAAEYAQAAALLRLKRNAIVKEAFCRRPDNNPAGDWEQAGALYAKAAALAKEYEHDEERAEALRWQAVCLLEGKTDALTPDSRRLLVQARRLGDTEAATLLGADKGRFCSACGATLEGGVKFCPNCGRDQTADQRPEKTPDAKQPTRRMGPGQGPGGPG